MTRLPRTTQTVAPILDRQLIETAKGWVRKYSEQVSAEDSHRHIQGWWMKLVREGKISILRLLELTGEKGAEIDADAALRQLAADAFEAGQELPKLVTAYLISRPNRPARGKGRAERDTWLRDQCVTVCVQLGIEAWPFLSFSRGASSNPSICLIISVAHRECGIAVGEKRVEQIYGRYSEFLSIACDEAVAEEIIWDVAHTFSPQSDLISTTCRLESYR